MQFFGAAFFLLRSASGCLSVCCCAGLLISATSRLILSLLSPPRWFGDATFLAKRKWPKIGQRGFPFGNPFDGKGLCGPYPQWRQAAVTVVPTSHVPPANAAKQVGRKYEWRHLPLRGSRGRHFTVFQSQPPGRQPVGRKVKSPRAVGPAPRPDGGGLGRQTLILAWGPNGRLEPSTNPVGGQAARPLGKPGASQNCPQLYQGESGGLEPSTKPVAGQAAATLHSLSPQRGSRALPGQSLVTFF